MLLKPPSRRVKPSTLQADRASGAAHCRGGSRCCRSQPRKRAWALEEIRGKVVAVLKQWLLTGQSANDELLYARGGGLVRARMGGEEGSYDEDLERTAQALSWNRPAYTSEVRFTDRVLKFHSRYWNAVAAEPLPSVNTELLYNMISGDLGDATILPLPAVRWGFSPRELRVKVLQASAQQLHAELYNAHSETRTGSLQLLRIAPGSADYQLHCRSGERVQSEESSLRLTLPAQELCRLEVEADAWAALRAGHGLCCGKHHCPPSSSAGRVVGLIGSAGLADVEVCLASDGPCSTTDADGAYQLEVVANQEHLLLLDGADLTPGAVAFVAEEAALQLANVSLLSSELVAGQFAALDQVWLEGTGVVAFSVSNGIDGDGVNVAEVEVSVQPAAGEGSLLQHGAGDSLGELTATSDNGGGVLINLVPALYQLQYSPLLETCELVLGWGAPEDHQIPVLADRVTVARISCPES